MERVACLRIIHISVIGKLIAVAVTRLSNIIEKRKLERKRIRNEFAELGYSKVQIGKWLYTI